MEVSSMSDEGVVRLRVVELGRVRSIVVEGTGSIDIVGDGS